MRLSQSGVKYLQTTYLIRAYYPKYIKNSYNPTAEKTTKQTEKNYSVISKKQLDDQMGQIIIKFIDYCNSGEINSAYELLSDDCKQILFPSIESFLNNYYNRIFLIQIKDEILSFSYNDLICKTITLKRV